MYAQNPPVPFQREAGWKVSPTKATTRPSKEAAKAQCQSLGAKDPTTLVYKQDAPARESDEESIEKARHVAAEVVRLLGHVQASSD